MHVYSCEVGCSTFILRSAVKYHGSKLSTRRPRRTFLIRVSVAGRPASTRDCPTSGHRVGLVVTKKFIEVVIYMIRLRTYVHQMPSEEPKKKKKKKLARGALLQPQVRQQSFVAAPKGEVNLLFCLRGHKNWGKCSHTNYNSMGCQRTVLL